MTAPSTDASPPPAEDAAASLRARRRGLRLACDRVLPGFLELSIVDELRRVADWCAEHGIEHDQYGEADWLQAFERKVATVLGKAAGNQSAAAAMLGIDRNTLRKKIQQLRIKA